MKYVLVDRNDDIVDEIDSVTKGGAEYYFMKRKTHTVKPGKYYLEVMKSGYRQNKFKFNLKY